MNVIRPEPGKVPRGTSARIWRHPFERHEVEAMAAGQKRQFRLRVASGNSMPPGRRRFADLDLTYGKPDTYRHGVASALHCRVRNEHPPRTVVLYPAVRLGDVIYPGNHKSPITEATDSLLVTEVYPQRLLAISEHDARLEGVAAAWGLKLATRRRAATAEEVHEALVEAVGSRNLKHWRALEEQADELTARNLFALDYLRRRRGGFQHWAINPWVWVIGFEWHPVRPSDLLRRLATGTLQRKSA